MARNALSSVLTGRLLFLKTHTATDFRSLVFVISFFSPCVVALSSEVKINKIKSRTWLLHKEAVLCLI